MRLHRQALFRPCPFRQSLAALSSAFAASLAALSASCCAFLVASSAFLASSAAFLAASAAALASGVFSSLARSSAAFSSQQPRARPQSPADR